MAPIKRSSDNRPPFDNGSSLVAMAEQDREQRERIAELQAEIERLREAIREHRDRVTRAQEEHGPPINALDEIDTDLWGLLDG